MKKKMSKKDKARLAARRNEELKLAVEQERIRLQEEEKRRQEEERRDAIEKEHRDALEQQSRVELLTASCAAIAKLRRKFLKTAQKDIEDKQWGQYLKCDGLPDPSNCGQMNTFLHLWDQIREKTSIDLAKTKTEQVLALLDTLDEFLDCPSVPEKQKSEWITVRNSFRTYQQYNLDCASYRLLRDIDSSLERLDIPTARYICEQSAFTVCLWALVQLPIATPNPKRAPRPRTALAFPEIQCEVDFPEELDIWGMCVRAMYVNYDHYSHLCGSSAPRNVPPELLLNLNEVTTSEWSEKMLAKHEFRAKVKTEVDAAAALAAAAAQTNPDNEDIVHAAQIAQRKKQEYVKVDASAIYVTIEDDAYFRYRREMLTTVDGNVVNLRRYRILGGVYFLDLFYQPPQPTTMVLNEITLATLQVPKWLQTAPFIYDYAPPPPPEAGIVRQPEEIEAEIKRQESEFERMVLVSLSLPSSVLWLDVPVVCQWDPQGSAWSTRHVHDAKHNEEKQTVQFRTGKFGAFAMAVYRYNSMPYQAWELRPTAHGTVMLTIMAAVLIIEFTIKENLVCVSQLQNAPNDALDAIVGIYYKLPKLKRILQRGGVDVFPDADAFCYMEGVCEKQWPMEQHLFYNMAQCCLYYNYSWSRWNLLAGRRKIIMQIREFSTSERVKLPNYSMLMVTPLKALLVDCTEVSQVFSEDGVEKMKFYPDLFNLIVGITSISMKNKLQKTSADLINTVAQLLIATRVTSLS